MNMAEHGQFHHVTQEEKDTCPICQKQRDDEKNKKTPSRRANIWTDGGYDETRGQD